MSLACCHWVASGGQFFSTRCREAAQPGAVVPLGLRLQKLTPAQTLRGREEPGGGGGISCQELGQHPPQGLLAAHHNTLLVPGLCCSPRKVFVHSGLNSTTTYTSGAASLHSLYHWGTPIALLWGSRPRVRWRGRQQKLNSLTFPGTSYP